MKSFKHTLTNRLWIACACTALSIFAAAPAAVQADVPTRQLKIGFVNFKTCVEKSKLGKQEQGTFEAMKKQMEGILGEKEKGLNEMAGKLSDADYLDSLAPDAETELKRKFRTLSQELSQAQNQYYQTLQQANYKIVQKIAETITKAAEKVASDLKLDAAINEDGVFFYAKDLDISDLVVAQMDLIYEKEQKEAKELPPVQPPTAAPTPATKK